MTAPAVTATRETSVVAAASRLEAKRIKRTPVVDAEGRLVGIVSRRDLLRMHTRPDSEIRSDVVDNVLRRSLRIDPLVVQVDVVNGVVTLNGYLETSLQDRCPARLGPGARRDAPSQRLPTGVIGVALIWPAVSPGTARGEAGKGFVLLEVAVPSLRTNPIQFSQGRHR
jgi:CBS domain